MGWDAGLCSAATVLTVLSVTAHGQSVFFQPFPLVKNLTVGSPVLTSAIFASSVNISVTGPSEPSAAATHDYGRWAQGCAEGGSVCAAVISRYQQLFSIKTSANGPRPACPANVTISDIAIRLDSRSEDLGPNTDESYEITITPFVAPEAEVEVSVTARTIFGARHALEVIAQMVADDPASTTLTDMCGNAGWLAATPISIRDRPANSYRGFMIDSGRHYLSIPRIRKTIDGLSMFRLNVLHWHITDSSSFPVKTDRHPELAAGAFAAGATYNTSELKGLVSYAKNRGVRIVPEFDMPGHGAWYHGHPELNLSSCSDVFDPTNEAVYTFLLSFLEEITEIFSDEWLFLGGDEVGFDPKCKWPGESVCGYHCFDRDPKVAAWMKTTGKQSIEMGDYFWQQLGAKVMARLPNKRTLGVWLADTPNGAGGGVWPAPHLSSLPPGSFVNVYQSLESAVAPLEANVTTVVSIAGSKWYLDYHPTFEEVWSVRPCTLLNCSGACSFGLKGAGYKPLHASRRQYASTVYLPSLPRTDSIGCASAVALGHPGWSKTMKGGETCMWGSDNDGKPRTMFEDAFAGGVAAGAERLWADPDPGTNATRAALQAEKRYTDLVCHWAMWGLPTFTRPTSRSVQIVPVEGPFTCAADWSTVPA